MEFKPYEYQKYAIDRMVNDPELGLFLDMGLGKTVITLTAIDELKYNRFEIDKALVIAPKKVAEATWTAEVNKWDHLKHLRVVKVLGTAKQRERALYTKADVYVINRDNVRWLVEQLRNEWCFDMVVCDEFSSFKNHKSERWKHLNWIRPHINRIVGLTGTPSPNGLEDLWAQIYLLDGGKRLGKSITQYRNNYFLPDKRNRHQIFSYKPDDGAEEQIRNKIGDICVSMKAEDYIELPECTYIDVPVVLSDKAMKSYLKLERDMLLEVDVNGIYAGTVDAGTAAVLANKLLQLCNGAAYDINGGTVEIHDDKLDALKELIESLNGQPALLFYSFRHDIERIKNILKPLKLCIGELKTESDVDKWNNREIDILLAHPQSAAYGLNLQAGGNHIVWFGLTWSLELYLQANARLHRQGQTERVFVHRLVVENGMDEAVVSALADKTSTQEAILTALKARIDRNGGNIDV